MRSPAEIDRLMQDFGVLNGSRAGPNRTGRAVRLADVQPLLQFPVRPKSQKAAGAAPTAAEFDALVEDVHAIFAQMAALAEALRIRQQT